MMLCSATDKKKQKNKTISNITFNPLTKETFMNEKQVKKRLIEFDNAMSDGEAFVGIYNKENEKEKHLTTFIVVPNSMNGEAQVSATLAMHLYKAMNGMGDESDKALLRIVTYAVKKVDEWCDEDDEKDEIEDCGDCEYMRTCNEENAIKYRKMHHIPKPQKKTNKKIS